jgi:hypothetical protein
MAVNATSSKANVTTRSQKCIPIFLLFWIAKTNRYADKGNQCAEGVNIEPLMVTPPSLPYEDRRISLIPRQSMKANPLHAKV